MTDIELVDRMARALQGKYGHASQFWSKSSEALREEWRRDAREVLAEFPSAPLLVSGLLQQLSLARAFERVATRHAARADADVAASDAKLARWSAERAELEARQRRTYLAHVDAELSGESPLPLSPGDVVVFSQARLLPGGTVLMQPDGWVLQRDITGLDAWFIANESGPIRSFYDDAVEWRLVLIGRGEPATDDEY